MSRALIRDIGRLDSIVGIIVPWVGGYFTNGSNGSYTRVLGATNDIAGANNYLNQFGFHVCDGAALNDVDSPIFNGAGRYLPNLTDSRFLQGSTTAGGIGGASAMEHTHSVTSNVAVAAHTALSHSGTAASFLKSVMNTNQGAHDHSIGPGWDGNLYVEQTLVSGSVHTGNFYYFAGTLTSGLYRKNGLTTVKSVAWTAKTVSCTMTQPSSHTISAHSITNNAVTSAGASVTENRPLYLSAFYIMRIK